MTMERKRSRDFSDRTSNRIQQQITGEGGGVKGSIRILSEVLTKILAVNSQKDWALRMHKILTGSVVSNDNLKCQSMIFLLYPTSSEKSQKVF